MLRSASGLPAHTSHCRRLSGSTKSTMGMRAVARTSIACIPAAPSSSAASSMRATGSHATGAGGADPRGWPRAEAEEEAASSDSGPGVATPPSLPSSSSPMEGSDGAPSRRPELVSSPRGHGERAMSTSAASLPKPLALLPKRDTEKSRPPAAALRCSGASAAATRAHTARRVLSKPSAGNRAAARTRSTCDRASMTDAGSDSGGSSPRKETSTGGRAAVVVVVAAAASADEAAEGRSAAALSESAAFDGTAVAGVAELVACASSTASWSA